mgnify:CR=1 FL=1
MIVAVSSAKAQKTSPQKTKKDTTKNKKAEAVVLEDGIRHGGIASTVSEMFRDAGLQVPIHSINQSQL